MKKYIACVAVGLGLVSLQGGSADQPKLTADQKCARGWKPILTCLGTESSENSVFAESFMDHVTVCKKSGDDGDLFRLKVTLDGSDQLGMGKEGLAVSLANPISASPLATRPSSAGRDETRLSDIYESDLLIEEGEDTGTLLQLVYSYSVNKKDGTVKQRSAWFNIYMAVPTDAVPGDDNYPEPSQRALLCSTP